VDRVIQQAIVLILTPIFDPGFSESSFGYRPFRSAQGAVKQIQKIIRSGRRQCVDMDLSKFFDRVQHDVLMSRVSRKVHDKRLLKLIGRYLRAGVMVDGTCQPSNEGTMQGGPLSPLLSNIYLDDLDKELEKRGLPFVRYAEFRSYAMGWLGYFALDQVKTTFIKLDKWLRRRVRACYWKQWRKSVTRIHKLMFYGLSYCEARMFGCSGKGPWRLSTTSGVQRSLSIQTLTDEGLLSLEKRWHELASLRRTA